MNSSTGSGEQVTGFSTPWGGGRLAMLGPLPFELELPAGAAGCVGTTAPGPTAATVSDERDDVGAAAQTWVERLEAYFAGRPVAFPLDVGAFCEAHGFTDFETRVYRGLALVPYGETVSYRDLGVAVGRPRAWRAVGSAMALNPLPVILPCHRVIRSDGRAGEYGGDPAWKTRLLRHEGVAIEGDRVVAREVAS